MSVEEDLSLFIRTHVRSVWALEVLLTLKREPDRCWAPAELVGELRASATLIKDVLQSLEHAELVMADEDDRRRFAPAGPVLWDLCGRLEAAYLERPVAVINMIARPDPLQLLANAFKIRGDGK